MKRYLPFLSGVYSTAPGLLPLSRHATNVFDIDEHYSTYIDNKINCRNEDLSKYHILSNFEPTIEARVNQFLLEKMLAEHPAIFSIVGDMNVSSNKTSVLKNSNTTEEIEISDGKLVDSKYNSLFDALCSQLQEDIAVVQLTDDKDWLAAIHLCSPNHWDPRTKIGRPFNEIHTPVPDIERTVKNYRVMLKMIVDKEPFIRFAWGISTDTRLNHHPEAPRGEDVEKWQGRKPTADSNELYIRTERQALIGLKDIDAFIFTIRTYFYKVSDLDEVEMKALRDAIKTMSSASLQYKGMTALKEL